MTKLIAHTLNSFYSSKAVRKTIPQQVNAMVQLYGGDVALADMAYNHRITVEEAKKTPEGIARLDGLGLVSGWTPEVAAFWRRNMNTTDDVISKQRWAQWCRGVVRPFALGEWVNMMIKNKLCDDGVFHLFILTINQETQWSDFCNEMGITDKDIYSQSDGYSLNTNMSTREPRLEWYILKFNQEHADKWKDSKFSPSQQEVDEYLTKIGAINV